MYFSAKGGCVSGVAIKTGRRHADVDGKLFVPPPAFARKASTSKLTLCDLVMSLTLNSHGSYRPLKTFFVRSNRSSSRRKQICFNPRRRATKGLHFLAFLACIKHDQPVHSYM